MDWSTIFASASGAVVGAPIGILLKSGIEHLFNVRRDTLAQQRLSRQKRREASAAVVEILAEWTHSTYLGRAQTPEEKWKLQTTYWRNILLLDKELVDLLFPTLANAPNAVGTNELIVQTRKILLELKQPDIKASELNNWKPKEET